VSTDGLYGLLNIRLLCNCNSAIQTPSLSSVVEQKYVLVLFNLAVLMTNMMFYDGDARRLILFKLLHCNTVQAVLYSVKLYR
jgi:hypothetical protein